MSFHFRFESYINNNEVRFSQFKSPSPNHISHDTQVEKKVEIDDKIPDQLACHPQ